MAVRLAIVFHFHEPLLVDPATGRATLPWVRLRALKDYCGTVEILRRHEKVRLTVSLSPSLVQQLERLPEDEYALLARKRPKELSRDEISFMLGRFFHEGYVGRFERYADLRRKKESEERFGHQDLRDLQVLSTLAWAHPLAFDSEKELAALREKGSSFDESDKRALFKACAEIARGILPAFSELGRSGRVELATSACHHAVLPLLCSPRFPGAPDATADAREQLTRARGLHERVFGSPPAGLWPPELALSERAFSMIAEAGYAWTIAEGGEARAAAERDGTTVVFRDRRLSELVAHGYRGVVGRAAAAELVSRVLRVGDGRPVILALDGGRAWDSGGQGFEFLDSFLEFLAEERRVSTCTVSEAASEGRESLESVNGASWADSQDLSPWSGEAAWRELFSARKVAMEKGSAHAREAVLTAEASDWFAAAGDERAPFREEYLALFRAHLESASAPAGESRVGATDGGLLAAMSFRADGGVLEIEVTPADGKGAELARKRLEVRLIEPVEARIVVAGIEEGGGKLFACDIEGRPHGRPFGEARLGKVLALKVPLDAVGASGGGETAFHFAVVEEEKVVERLPPRGPAWAG